MRKSFILVILSLSLLLSSCGIGLENDFLGFAFEWLETKDIFKCIDESGPEEDDCEFEIDYWEVAKYTTGMGENRDPGLQAAVDTGKTVMAINEADALAEDGFANNDT